MPVTLPIPLLHEPPDWRRLPIEECGEPLVTIIPGLYRITTRSLYAAQGIPGAPIDITVRSGVYTRLQRAAESLPPGIVLVVFDGYRPLRVQQYLWDTYHAEIAARHPEWSPLQLEEATAEFIARPSADPACPPPHRTGGAVDVYLEDQEGTHLAMGTEPDELSPASTTRYFEEHPRAAFAGNRRILYHAMTAAGFTNYLAEWWHYDFGNQRWANCSGLDCAIYGIAE